MYIYIYHPSWMGSKPTEILNSSHSTTSRIPKMARIRPVGNPGCLGKLGLRRKPMVKP